MVIALTGIVCADQPVPAVPETQTLSTGTTADVVGLAMETDAGAWTLTTNPTYFIALSNETSTLFPPNSDALTQLLANGGGYTVSPAGFLTSMTVPSGLLNQIFPGNLNTWADVIQDLKTPEFGYTEADIYRGIHNGALDQGQVQYTTAYDANIVAQAGHTVFTKNMNIHTGNKVIGQSNLDAKTALTYIATADGGNVVGSENLMLDGAGMNTAASDRMLCPFSSQPIDQIPAYCNIIQAGSKYDLTFGSVTTNANDRFVGTDATNPVVLNYDINVKPYGTSQGQIPAMGSAMAYIKAHIQEARVNGTAKAEDLTYNEQSGAQGTITAFTKVIAYQSGKSLL
jgi:hypothetical protein